MFNDGKVLCHPEANSVLSEKISLGTLFAHLGSPLFYPDEFFRVVATLL